MTVTLLWTSVPQGSLLSLNVALLSTQQPACLPRVGPSVPRPVKASLLRQDAALSPQVSRSQAPSP